MTSPDEKNAAQQPSTAIASSEPSQEDSRQGGTAVAAPTPELAGIKRALIIADEVLAECDKAGMKGAYAYPDEKLPLLAIALKSLINQRNDARSELAAARAEVERVCNLHSSLMKSADERAEKAESKYDAVQRRIDEAAKELPPSPPVLVRFAQAEGETETALLTSHYDTLRQQLADVIARGKVDAEDAARYRWLRKRANTWIVRQFIHNHWRTLMTNELDAAIDAEKQGGGT